MRDLAWLEWPLTWLAISIGVIGIAWSIAWGNTITEIKAIEHNYDIVKKREPNPTGGLDRYNDYIKPKVQVAPGRIEE